LKRANILEGGFAPAQYDTADAVTMANVPCSSPIAAPVFSIRGSQDKKSMDVVSGKFCSLIFFFSFTDTT
jgi:hypothetical protein